MKKIVSATGTGGVIIIILFLLILFNFIIPSITISRLETAVNKLIEDTNKEIGMEYIRGKDIRNQCRDMINQRKTDAGSSLLHVGYAEIDKIPDADITLQDYDINQTTEELFIELFHKAAEEKVIENIKTISTSSSIESLDLYISQREGKDYSVAFGQDQVRMLKSDAEWKVEDKCRQFLTQSEDYKKMNIVWKLKDSANKDNVAGYFDNINISSIEKQNDDTFEVSFDSLPLTIFSDAVTPGYRIFDSSNQPPFFDSLPKDKVESAYTSGVKEVMSGQTAEPKTLMIPVGVNNGSEYDAFISEVNRSYYAGLNQMTTALNDKFLIKRKSMPKTKVLGTKRKGRPLEITAYRRHIWLRFFKLPSKSIKRKGRLVLSCFVRKRNTLNVKLPPGYYKIIQGDDGRLVSWYGSKYGFADSANYQQWNDPLHIQPNYMYTLQTGISNGNSPASNIPWNQHNNQ
jgi:hypothetical protein